MEKPILFNTEMVKAILSGQKTQTRRIIKPQPKEQLRCVIPHEVSGMAYWIETNADQRSKDFMFYKSLEVGDTLWVQETWLMQSMSRFSQIGKVLFKATPNDVLSVAHFKNDRYEKFLKFADKNGWQSPYFMPKEATRIWLKVTNVRCERLKDITEDGASKEGTDYLYENGYFNYFNSEPYTSVEAFEWLWESIYAKQGNGWDINPWVWVIEFERMV